MNRSDRKILENMLIQETAKFKLYQLVRYNFKGINDSKEIYYKNQMLDSQSKYHILQEAMYNLGIPEELLIKMVDKGLAKGIKYFNNYPNPTLR